VDGMPEQDSAGEPAQEIGVALLADGRKVRRFSLPAVLGAHEFALIEPAGLHRGQNVICAAGREVCLTLAAHGHRVLHAANASAELERWLEHWLAWTFGQQLRLCHVRPHAEGLLLEGEPSPLSVAGLIDLLNQSTEEPIAPLADLDGERLDSGTAARAYFESDDTWADFAEPYQLQLLHLVRHLVPSRNARILDVGCGNGLITNVMTSAFDVTGVDLSEKALRAVRAPKCRASVTALPFTDNSFDLVYCFDVLEHLQRADVHTAMRELQRVSRNLVLVAMPFQEDLPTNSVVCESCRRSFHVNGHLRSVDFSTLVDLPLGPGFLRRSIFLSGDLTTPPLDRFSGVARTRGLGVRPGPMPCPHCGAHASHTEDKSASAETDRHLGTSLLHSLRAYAMAGDEASLANWFDRSEGALLLQRVGNGSVVESAASLPSSEPAQWCIHFTDPLQCAADFTVGRRVPSFRLGRGTQIGPYGLELVASDVDQDSPTSLRFPVRPHKGARLELVFDASVNPARAEFSLYGIDGLNRRVVKLAELRAVDSEVVTIELPSPCWWVDRFGLALDLYLYGVTRIRQITYISASAQAEWTVTRLKPGFNVVKAGAFAKLPVYWTYFSLTESQRRIGRLPLSPHGRAASIRTRWVGANVVARTLRNIHSRIEEPGALGGRTRTFDEIEAQRAALLQIAQEMPWDVRLACHLAHVRRFALERKKASMDALQKGYWTARALLGFGDLGWRASDMRALLPVKRLYRGLRSTLGAWGGQRLPLLRRMVRLVTRLFFSEGPLNVELALRFDDPRWQQGLSAVAVPKPGAVQVLVLSHMFPHPERPGSGSFVHEQVQALREAGVDARVICGRPFWLGKPYLPTRLLGDLLNYTRFLRGSQDRWWNVDGVPVRYIPYLIFAPFWAHGWSYRIAVSSNLPILRREFPATLIHAHTGYLDGSAAQMIAKAWNVPYVVTEHTGPFSMLMRRAVVERTTLNAIAGADRLISVSHSLLRDVQGYLGNRRVPAEVIPNVVDTRRFTVTRANPGDPSAPRLLFVGYFVDVKNIPLLLQAFLRVLAEKPGARLTLIGGGETLAQTTALTAEISRLGIGHAVRVRGFMPRDEIARAMREDCDLLVLQSKSETFGCVVAEALASGRPAVVTRCGGPEDIVTEPWMGALCENHDVQALADAIKDVANRLPLMEPERLSRSAHDRFSGVAVAQRLIVAYDVVLKGRLSTELASAAQSRELFR
jgi:glycosyltransferase involved in cell wall biosynthesis/SAM-dependent methyltransferase